MDWLPTSASTFAPQVDMILWMVTIISVVSCILVGFLLIYFVVKYKRNLTMIRQLSPMIVS